MEKTEDSTKVKDHALQVENMSELEKIDLLACKITAKLVIANEEKKRKEITITESNEFWIDSDEFWICNPCLCHSSSKNMPDHLKHLKRGCFGYVGKTGKKSMIKASKGRHLKSSLHKWCVQEYLKVAERKIAADRRNDLAGKKIVRNALFCFKQSLSSADFMALNMKDFLAEEEFGSELFNIATQNNSKAEFFRLRNVIFDVVTKQTHKFLKKISRILLRLWIKVQNICVFSSLKRQV